MEKIDVSSAKENLQQVKKTTLPRVEELPFELLNGQNKKTTKLVASSGDDSTMSGSNRWFEYEFDEPVFLFKVVVTFEKYSVYDKFEFQWETAGGERFSSEACSETGSLLPISINQMVKSVGFKPPRKYLSEPIINSVSLKGFKADELESFLEKVSHLDSMKNNIVATCEIAIQNADQANEKAGTLRTEQEALEAENTAARDKITELNNQIGRLTEERNAIQTDIKNREGTISGLNQTESEIVDQLAEKQSQKTALITQVSDKTQELRSLQNDINMFPTEISGFVSQAAQNAKSYWFLASVPIAIIVGVTGLLISNAANLTTLMDENDNARIMSILITRLPYVIIATAIIGAAYKLAAMFVWELCASTNRSSIFLKSVLLRPTYQMLLLKGLQTSMRKKSGT